MKTSRVVHADCRYYRGSMPCRPHKATGQLCEDCPHYSPLSERILIVKLGAMGDVLRTAALLPDIVARHDHPHVTWLTRAESVELLADNPLLQRVVTTNESGSLGGAQFDAVYALDSAPEALAFAYSVRTEAYYGFVAGKFGTCTGVAPGGDPALYEMGLWDDFKRANRRSYLELLGASAGLQYGGHRPHVPLDPAELRRAKECARSLPRPLIGINTDAGDRWERKNWNPEHVAAFAQLALADGCGVMLFGGSPVHDRNVSLAASLGSGALAFESAGNVRRLIAGIDQCDALLTGDTLAMHIGWALDVPMTALFGPTSLYEIDLGAGAKMAAEELPCLACYLKTCSVDPHCMDRLLPAAVYARAREVLITAARSPRR
jgi:ADP-heptose:LPS heptosyltransferase